MQYVVSLLFVSLRYFLITRLMSSNILFMFVFLFCMLVFHFVYSVFFIVLFTVSPFVYSCLFPICTAQVYRPLPPGGNPIAVNKYNIISYQYLEFII